MKKSLIALAIAGAFVAPVAMAADATIYGHANVSFDSVSTGNGTTLANGTVGGASSVSTNQVSSNASYLGVKGSEDLGGGLSAVWQIESGINIDNNNAGTNPNNGTATGAFATRNTFAGLSGESWGTVLLGNHDTPYKIATRGLDLFADTIADNRTLMGAAQAAGAGFDGRQGNVVAYISPAMSGMTVAVAYVAGAEAATSAVGAQKGSAWSLAGMYNAGPLNASLAYEVHDLGTAGTGTVAAGAAGIAPTPKESAWKLGVGYTMDQFAVNAAYEKTTDNFGGTLAGGTVGGNYFGHSAYYLAGKFNVTASDAVKLAYTHVGDLNFADLPGAADTLGKLNTASHQVSLGYDHGLSKRTTVYALYTKLTNGQGSNYALLNAGTNGGVVNNGFNSSPSAVSLGMKHTF